MKTKADFQQAIADSISGYPVAAQFYQVRDPRLLSQLDAMATMLAMISSEQDVAAMEPFTKARDMTVLADAAVKGVLPFGSPTTVKILAANNSNTSFVVQSGRRLRDSQGRIWSVTVGATVPANGTAVIEAEQASSTSFEHTVTVSRGFYRIDVPKPDNGHIVSVAVADAQSVPFEYVVEFVNVEPGDKVFHLETDEYRQLYIQFGASGTAGYQPSAGEKVTVILSETEGAITLSATTLFTFEYTSSVYESGSKMSLAEVIAPGSGPMDIATMREVCSYPSTYDSNAVFLGNFDFLVRRNLSPFKFLSIWNEQREEEVRGANYDNINCLFVSARKSGVADTTLRQRIERIIKTADDSYRIKHVPVVDVLQGLQITIQAQPVYDFAAVKQQAIELVLGAYGEDSAWAKRGEASILYKDVYDLLTENIQALRDRDSDLRMTVAEQGVTRYPEQFRYVSPLSLTVNVVQK